MVVVVVVVVVVAAAVVKMAVVRPFACALSMCAAACWLPQRLWKVVVEAREEFGAAHGGRGAFALARELSGSTAPRVLSRKDTLRL